MARIGAYFVKLAGNGDHGAGPRQVLANSGNYRKEHWEVLTADSAEQARMFEFPSAALRVVSGQLLPRSWRRLPTSDFRHSAAYFPFFHTSTASNGHSGQIERSSQPFRFASPPPSVFVTTHYNGFSVRIMAERYVRPLLWVNVLRK
jgi:hypothetical protein